MPFTKNYQTALKLCLGVPTANHLDRKVTAPDGASYYLGSGVDDAANVKGYYSENEPTYNALLFDIGWEPKLPKLARSLSDVPTYRNSEKSFFSNVCFAFGSGSASGDEVEQFNLASIISSGYESVSISLGSDGLISLVIKNISGADMKISEVGIFTSYDLYPEGVSNEYSNSSKIKMSPLLVYYDGFDPVTVGAGESFTYTFRADVNFA